MSNFVIRFLISNVLLPFFLFSTADTKPSWMRSRVSVISVEPDLQSTELQDEFSQVAEVTIPHPFRDYVSSQRQLLLSCSVF